MVTENSIWNNKNLIKVLKEGGVVVMPTDTIYGIVGRAEDEAVVNRIYQIRKRSPRKPCIILIGDINELLKFGVNISEQQKVELEKYWNGERPTSIILDCPIEKFTYLHRGTNTLAFRLPVQPGLRELLTKTGPLIAPSANFETFPPNNNIKDAKKYFGDSVDLYIDGGTSRGKASKLIKLHKDGSVDTLRN